MMAAKERGDAAGRGEQQQAFSSYTLGLEGGGTALPRGLPLAWKLGGSSASGPFDRAVWGTDEALTDVRVLVEKDRLRLGGKGLKAGEAVSCAGVVEPGQGDAALFVAGCQDATGSVSYRVHRVLLSGLARVLAGGTPGLLMGIPSALRGTFKTDVEDCKAAKGEVTVSASAIAEKGGPSVVAITATSSRLGTVLSGVNPADGRLCSAVVDEVAGVVRLRTTCNGRARYLLCKR